MIQYKKGYKYQLVQDYTVQTAVKTGRFVLTSYLKLTSDGLLTISAGYAWDGPSGPTIDTKNFMRSSLPHDAFYGMMRNGLLDRDKWRKVVDEELRRMCREDGMSWFRAWYVYLAVRRGAVRSASADARKPIITAP